MKVLIVKIAAVGDVVMALPMLHELYKIDSKVEITWVCGRTVAPLLRATGKIRELVVVDERPLLNGTLLEKFRSVASVWMKLLGQRFDLILTGHADPRYRLLSMACRGDVRRAFASIAAKAVPTRNRYMGDEYAQLAAGHPVPHVRMDGLIKLEAPDVSDLGRVLDAAPGLLVALAPGGAANVMRSDPLRRWPVQSYARLASYLIEEGVNIVLTGAKSDEWIREAFEGLPIIDVVGKTSLLDLVALYAACSLVITHDSGPMHLAFLAGTPTLCLFGPTTPAQRVPESGKNVVIWGGEGLRCRPCYDGKNYAPCASNECLQSITAEQAFEMSLRMLHDH